MFGENDDEDIEGERESQGGGLDIEAAKANMKLIDQQDKLAYKQKLKQKKLVCFMFFD